ncbi:MAG TPA: hypothetical protein PLD46_09280 [Hyphomicrobium sp.]|nr:hypothetical protein [Hyphomicrobium sp.]
MNKATQLWDIDRKRAFFRAFLQREKNLDSAAAEKLADTLANAVNMMRVWELPEPAPAPVAPVPTVAKSAEPVPKSKGKAAPSEQPPAPVTSIAPFDPFAFSPIVVLVKTGKDGLMKRLLEIKSVEHLKAFSEAQHLAVSPSLKKADDLRKAIVAATEQRLADRKAAAS